MGHLKVILLENKIFELSLEVGSITKSGRKVTKQLVLNFSLVKWMVQTLKDYFHLEISREFIKSSSSGNRAFIAQRSSNTHGHFLTIVEYVRGGRRDLMIIPKAINGNGWKKMAMELRAHSILVKIKILRS